MGGIIRTATFALFIGIAYLAIGVLGLIPAALQPPPADAPPVQLNIMYGYLLGLFPVNIVHTATNFAVGAWGIVAWQSDHLSRGLASPKVYARALAVIYGALAVLGVVPVLHTLFGVLPIHGNDVWLHAATAALAAYFGWRTEAWLERRAGIPDRRQQSAPVAHERRLGHADRRAPGSEV